MLLGENDLANSGSYARGDRPRSVPDPDAAAYEAAMRWQRAHNATQEALNSGHRAGDVPPTLSGHPMTGSSHAPGRHFEHPGALESLVPVWGSGKEALADLEDRNYVGAAVNAALAASDVILAKAILSGALKGGLKLGGSHAWRSAPWQQQGARAWLQEKGFVRSGQPAHHWWLDQRSKAPDWLKNQPPFIKPMRDEVQHGLVHGPYTVEGSKLRQFNSIERLWHGTPQWVKAGYVSSAGHAGAGAARVGREPRQRTDRDVQVNK
jgi:hypothetical protein